ncbi:Remorin_C domain-containing protein [Cephalotus follicularis]|uniref:Remorin_C domain-containing protein n=1 Tax=Cephalotus follicularis TaxID=3775 RepID=A0A1Q3BNZ2_CEPFO|nr:Remorin_C domain-containing protein [Cephalotus follicularis]
MANSQDSQFVRSSARPFPRSKAKIIRWQKYGRCCPSWSMKPLLDALPDSPSPICSNGFSPLTAATSDSFHSQSSRKLSNASKISTSSLGIDEWIKNNGTYQPNLCNNCHIEVKQSSSPKCCLSMSSMYGSPLTTINPEVCSMSIALVKEDSSSICDEESRHSSYNRVGNAGSSGGPEKLMTRPKPFHAFMDQVRTQEFEAEIDAWKKAKHRKLMTKLRRKEGAISDWEFQQTMKAMKEMKKLESKLERSRVEALETTQKRIDRARKEATEKKKKARESAVKKISRVTSLSQKIRATKNFNWLKLK